MSASLHLKPCTGPDYINKLCSPYILCSEWFIIDGKYNIEHASFLTYWSYFQLYVSSPIDHISNYKFLMFPISISVNGTIILYDINISLCLSNIRRVTYTMSNISSIANENSILAIIYRGYLSPTVKHDHYDTIFWDVISSHYCQIINVEFYCTSTALMPQHTHYSHWISHY